MIVFVSFCNGVPNKSLKSSGDIWCLAATWWLVTSMFFKKIVSQSVEVWPSQKQLFIYTKAGAGHFVLSKLEMRPSDSFFFSPFLPK